MAKLTDDPRVAALVQKTETSAVARTVIAAVKAVSGLSRAHAADAKQAGNPDGARRITTLGKDAVAALRVIAAGGASVVAAPERET